MAQPAEPGPAAEALARRGPGPFQVLYRTSSMDAAARWMADHGVPPPARGVRNTGEQAILVAPTRPAARTSVSWVRRERARAREVGMDYGLFTMPSHPPERSLFDGHQWDLQQLRWADELGFSEAWIGEHHTAPWEPHPAPDLLVAQALMQTKRMRIGPGGFLMPYHHPAELANRVAMLDHLAQGRLNFGVAASGLPSDWAMFNVDGMSGQHREMTRESLDIILRLWSDEPEFDYKGKYWHVTKTGTMLDTLRPHIKPLPEAASADRRGRA